MTLSLLDLENYNTEFKLVVIKYDMKKKLKLKKYNIYIRSTYNKGRSTLENSVSIKHHAI